MSVAFDAICKIPSPASRFGKNLVISIDICALHKDTFRFGELKRKFYGITSKMLTQQLRKLEVDGLVTRKTYNTVPPKVEYSLTEMGYSFRDVLIALSNWGSQIQDRKSALDRMAS